MRKPASSRCEYRILREGIDFGDASADDSIDRGTRAKRVVIAKNSGKKAIFKYDTGKFHGSEDCSEKIASELAKTLGYKTAEIDLAETKNGAKGILSYLFVNREKDETHEDAESYLNIPKNLEKEQYTFSHIEEFLNSNFPDIDFDDFIKIVVFDVLVGNRDRHQGNWGIFTKNGHHSISPLYDTSACLLRDLNHPKFLNKVLSGEKDIDEFIRGNQLAFYDDNGKRYQPVETAIDDLLRKYPKQTLKELDNLQRLSDPLIINIVNSIPEQRMSQIQKDYIIDYLIKQRNIMILKGEQYEKK